MATSFNDMLNEAVKLRTATDASLRSEFDAMPPFMQATLFAQPAVLAARKKGMPDRLQDGEELKLQGTEHLKAGRNEDATHSYAQVNGGGSGTMCESLFYFMRLLAASTDLHC